MSISLKEIIKDTSFNSLSPDIQSNLMVLLERINRIRDAYGKSMTVTSGLRTKEDQIRIYKAKGITDPAKIPMKSLHLSGGAVDISDPNKELQAWCLKNEFVLANVALWCEHFSATPNWVHFQIQPPKSQNRFFMP